MTGYLKDDLTVALDDVDRILFRAVTIHEQLGHLAVDPALAGRLHARGRKLETALDRFNRARKAEGQVPELEDPERAQLHVWWLKLKAWVSQASAEESVRSSLEEFDATVLETIDRARALNPDRQLAEALDQARADLENLDRV